MSHISNPSIQETTANEVIEQPSGLINGSNQIFTTGMDFDTSSLKVFLNGQLVLPPSNYTITGADQITMVDPPRSTPGNTDEIVTMYIPV